MTTGPSTLNCRVTGGAAAYVALPACAARTLQVPPPSSVSLAPFVPVALHTDGVVVVNETASSDDAEAASATGECATVVRAGAAKVIVCGSLVTTKLRVTVGAASCTSSPGCAARTVHVPPATRVIVVPLVPPAVQTLGVVVVNVTARFDDAVAATTIGVWSTRTLGSAANVMVCGVLCTPSVWLTDGAAL